MPGIIKAADHNALVASLNSLSAIENKGAAALAAVNAGDVIRADSFAALQAAVNRLESSFSGNCCQSVNSDCCQSCQKTVNCTSTCQSCQKTASACQSCQSTSCQRAQCQCNCVNCNCG